MWILLGLGVLSIILMIERQWDLSRRTNVDGVALVGRLASLIAEGKLEEAYKLCALGGKRALPRILGAGIKRAGTSPELVRSAMEEESLHMIPRLETRLTAIVTIGNIATLLGLMGTIYGLILAFAVVGRPEIPPMEKSRLLAIGISAAMNTTLLGLIIAVPCVMVYSAFRAKIDETIAEIDRYGVAVLKVLLPADAIQKSYRVTGKRIVEEIETEPNMVPFMNLMVTLIPLLLSSAEFVKIGAIELKLPEGAQVSEGGGGEGQQAESKLDAGVVITAKGFNLFHYFKSDSSNAAPKDVAEIPLKEGEYDFETLNKRLGDVKRKALIEVIKGARPDFPATATLQEAAQAYASEDFTSSPVLKDHESIKIVGEDKIKYKTVVAVMDAARSITIDERAIGMFPNVSIAGGIVE